MTVRSGAHKAPSSAQALPKWCMQWLLAGSLSGQPRRPRGVQAGPRGVQEWIMQGFWKGLGPGPQAHGVLFASSALDTYTYLYIYIYVWWWRAKASGRIFWRCCIFECHLKIRVVLIAPCFVTCFHMFDMCCNCSVMLWWCLVFIAPTWMVFDGLYAKEYKQ